VCNRNIACTLTKVRLDWLAYFFLFLLVGLCRRDGAGGMFGTGSPDDGPKLSAAPSRHIGFIVVGANYSCRDQLCLNVKIGLPNIRTLSI
jgi:hypothetical protein